jgi:hypothetical protein
MAASVLGMGSSKSQRRWVGATTSQRHVRAAEIAAIDLGSMGMGSNSSQRKWRLVTRVGERESCY